MDAAVAGVVVRRTHHEREEGLSTSSAFPSCRLAAPNRRRYNAKVRAQPRATGASRMQGALRSNNPPVRKDQ